VESLHFTIGDITVQFTVPQEQGEFPLPEPYVHFTSDRTPDVTIAVHTDFSTLNGAKAEKIFDTGPSWSLSRYREQNVVHTMFVDALCDRDYSHVDIYPLAEPEEVISGPVFLAYPLPEIIMINLLARHDGVLLHACGIIDQDKGILFCGMSGAGKSTLANIWQQESKSVILSDDRIIVRKVNGTYMMYGTPWHGEAGHCSARSVPLSKIFFIEHGQENQEQDISRTEAVSHMVTRSFSPLWDKDGMAQTLAFLDNMSQQIPCARLGVVPDGRIIEYVRTTLKG
jgi:hypothetical protein